MSGPALERLWAGWRSAFVSSVADGAGGPGVGGSSVAGSSVAGSSVAGSSVAGSSVGGPAPECVFCAILASGLPDAETHILWRHGDGLAIAILNLYPYTSGHLMVMPTRHVGDVEALTPDESIALWEAMADAVRALKAAYRPDALNLGANIGRAAGAGVPGHFHLHVVPRWNGDTNFMTTVADARVLPEALGDTRRRILAAWPAGARSS